MPLAVTLCRANLRPARETLLPTAEGAMPHSESLRDPFAVCGHPWLPCVQISHYIVAGKPSTYQVRDGIVLSTGFS
jgi:hypothetical protein